MKDNGLVDFTYEAVQGSAGQCRAVRGSAGQCGAMQGFYVGFDGNGLQTGSL